MKSLRAKTCLWYKDLPKKALQPKFSLRMAGVPVCELWVAAQCHLCPCIAVLGCQDSTKRAAKAQGSSGGVCSSVLPFGASLWRCQGWQGVLWPSGHQWHHPLCPCRQPEPAALPALGRKGQREELGKGLPDPNELWHIQAPSPHLFTPSTFSTEERNTALITTPGQEANTHCKVGGTKWLLQWALVLLAGLITNRNNLELLKPLHNFNLSFRLIGSKLNKQSWYLWSFTKQPFW